MDALHGAFERAAAGALNVQAGLAGAFAVLFDAPVGVVADTAHLADDPVGGQIGRAHV